MLQRPWLTPIVVVFWCLTSGWLFVEKILPSLSPGSPPGMAVYSSSRGLIPVAWTVQWNDRPLGWAITETRRSPLGGLLVDSRMHFERVPLDEIVPSWTGVLFRNALPKGGGMTLDARSRMVLDAGGDLRSFASTVDVPGSTDPVVLNGVVNSGTVRVNVEAGGMRYETTRHIPERIMLGDELSPQATMPGLFEGRRWTVPLYSPLRAAGSPIEILHAEVGAEETIYWEGQLTRVHVVNYREEPGGHHEPRCRLWVDRTGRVLRQEAALLGSRLLFVRRSDSAASLLAANLAKEAGLPDERPPSTEAVP